MVVIIGYIVVLIAVLGGFKASGGHLLVLFQPYEMLTIAGAGLGAFFSSNSASTIKKVLSMSTGTLTASRHDKAFYSELVLSFFILSQKIRKEGFLSLEAILDSYGNDGIFTPKLLKDAELMDFIRDNLRLLVTGIEEYQLEELMDESLEVYHEDAHVIVKAINRVSDAMPAFGIVAAVMGVVHTMGSLHLPPAELGKLIAGALIGTFLGILIAYGFVSPVAALVEERLETEGNVYRCAQKGILCCAKGISPVMTAEYMRAMISATKRPSFVELEAKLKATKG